MSPLKLLGVFAHPDDESMGMGATFAKYSAEGVETHLVCASRGERGWSGPEEQFPGLEGLGKIRTSELENAAALLGIQSLSFLGYIDGDVDQANHAEAISRIVTHIRKIQPQVVVTFPHDGIYGHPDHIAIGQFTTAAIVCAADSSYKDAENLPAYRVSKLYYMVDSMGFIELVAPFMDDMTFPVDGQVRGENPWHEWMITTRIDTTDYCRIAWRAIHCHQTQLGSIGRLVELDEDTAVPILAKQGTFYRAFSLVNGGRKIETDFFEGLR
ncbi:MAG: PIG-L family deacetylase [Anaerolineales bacterium]|jgi:LmbE family N-acetylglucosaminyl deacetylase|nr:PIG-L family deacetylase [Anaerolineales bacterium]